MELPGASKLPLRNSRPQAGNLRAARRGPEGPLDGSSVHSPKTENIDLGRPLHVAAKSALRPRFFMPMAKRLRSGNAPPSPHFTRRSCSRARACSDPLEMR